MTEPQIWTVIGVFAGGLLIVLVLMSTMFLHVLRTEVRSIHHRIDRLDSDISALMRHTFGVERSD